MNNESDGRKEELHRPVVRVDSRRDLHESSPAHNDKGDPNRYLRKIDDTYIFDAASGIYKPQSYGKQKAAQEESSNGIEKTPLEVKLRRDWLAIAISVLTLAGIWLYTRYAGQQLHEAIKSTGAAIAAVGTARQSLKDANKNFAQDQRPYVWKIVSHPHPIISNQRMAVDIYFANYGKAPAIKLKTVAAVFYGKNAVNQADSWFARVSDKLPKIGSVSVVPPGIPPDPQKTAVLFTTAISDNTPTQDEVNYITVTDGSLVWVAHVEYFDTNENFFQSDMCEFRLANGNMANCLKHNEIK